MTNSLDGLVETVKCDSTVTVGDGKTLKCLKIGKKIGQIKSKDGKQMKEVLDNVRYIPDLYCNLIKETIETAKKVAPSVEPKKVLEKKDKSEKTKTVAEIDREKLEKKFPKKKVEKLN